MSYEVFRNTLFKELRDFYGKDAVITIGTIKDKDGRYFDGIDIFMQDSKNKECHSINLNVLYDKYTLGEMDIYDCVESIYREQEGGE